MYNIGCSFCSLGVQNIISADTGISRQIKSHSFGVHLISESVSVTPSSVIEASIVLCSVSLWIVWVSPIILRAEHHTCMCDSLCCKEIWNIFRPNKYLASYNRGCTLRNMCLAFMQSARYVYYTSTKSWIWWQIVLKLLSNKFRENSYRQA
jgi:hypothetical protein